MVTSANTVQTLDLTPNKIENVQARLGSLCCMFISRRWSHASGMNPPDRRVGQGSNMITYHFAVSASLLEEQADNRTR